PLLVLLPPPPLVLPSYPPPPHPFLSYFYPPPHLCLLPFLLAPKCVKIFINLPRSMDFDDAERSEATQTLDLAEEDFKDDGLIPLRYVKFQNVQSVTMFVKNNQGDEETTKINYLTFIGTPVQATNMNDFKRVVGKKGESH
ncbi:unnamed protein product, partial [Oncorhynchus mykiss]